MAQHAEVNQPLQCIPDLLTDNLAVATRHPDQSVSQTSRFTQNVETSRFNVLLRIPSVVCMYAQLTLAELARPAQAFTCLRA